MQSKRIPSVFIYFALVFALSIPFWALGIIYPIQLLPGLPISALGALAPAAAALILAYRSEHSNGVLRLLGRCIDLKRVRDKGWFLVILLVNSFIAVLAYGIIDTFQPIPLPAPLTLAVLPMFAFFFLGALAEEIGWTGYATEPLQQRWGTLITGLALGLVWAVWHFVPLLQADRAIEWIAWWSLGTVALRVIMVWLYVHAGKSVFAAALFHAMINLCWQLFPIDGSYYDPRVFGLLALGVAAVLFAVSQFLLTDKLPPGS